MKKRNGPLEFSNAPGSDDDHGWLDKVSDVEQHVSRVLGVPGLAGEGYVELRPLQKANRLPNEEVSQALALNAV